MNAEKCGGRLWKNDVWLMKRLSPFYTGGFYDGINTLLNQMSSCLPVIGKTCEVIWKYLSNVCPSDGCARLSPPLYTLQRCSALLEHARDSLKILVQVANLEHLFLN